MVKGMLSIHIGIVLLLGHVALLPSSGMSLSPLRCCHMSYPGHVIVPHWRRLIIVVLTCCPCMLSSCVLVMLSLCHGLLVLCLSRLSRHCPCPSCVIVVPCHWSIIVLCVSKVGWDEWGGGVLTRVLVVIVAHDVVLPCCRWLFHCWLCAMVVGGRWRQWLLGAGDRCCGWWLKARHCC